MEELEVLIGLILAATLLAALARRVGALSPVFVARGAAGGKEDTRGVRITCETRLFGTS